MVGLFVSFFVGEQILISGIKKERKIEEKTEEEIKKESISLNYVKADLEEIKEQIKEIKKKIEKSGKVK